MDIQLAPIYEDQLTGPDQHPTLEKEFVRTNQYGGKKISFYLPYFADFLAFTRELSPNTQRSPLYKGINFSLRHLKLRKEPLRSDSVFCAVELALKNTERIKF